MGETEYGRVLEFAKRRLENLRSRAFYRPYVCINASAL